MVLIKLHQHTVLQVVERDTKFGAASFLFNERSADVWEAFMEMFVTAYVGLPDCVELYQGTQFQRNEF